VEKIGASLSWKQTTSHSGRQISTSSHCDH